MQFLNLHFFEMFRVNSFFRTARVRRGAWLLDVVLDEAGRSILENKSFLEEKNNNTESNQNNDLYIFSVSSFR